MMLYTYCSTVATMLMVPLLILLAAKSTNTSERMCSKGFAMAQQSQSFQGGWDWSAGYRTAGTNASAEVQLALVNYPYSICSAHELALIYQW